MVAAVTAYDPPLTPCEVVGILNDALAPQHVERSEREGRRAQAAARAADARSLRVARRSRVLQEPGLRGAVLWLRRNPQPTQETGQLPRFGQLDRDVRRPLWFGCHVDGPPGEEMVDRASLIQRPRGEVDPSPTSQFSGISVAPQ